MARIKLNQRRIYVDVTTTHTKMRPDEITRGVVWTAVIHRAAFSDPSLAEVYRKHSMRLCETNEFESTTVNVSEEQA